MILTMIAVCTLSGCKNEKAAEQTTELTTAEPTTEMTEATTEDLHKGQALSRLSGEWREEDVVNRRPIAVMINNIKQAQPQSGLADADIVYECLVEGGITRFMALFEQYDSIEKLGSVRSARHYYVEIADEYDAIFAHYGQTKYAVSEIQKRGMDTLSGLSSLGSTIYYRDSNRVAPHNAYTNAKGLLEGIKRQNSQTEYKADQEPHFQFHEQVEKQDGEAAKTVKLNYSTYSTPYFEYDEQEGVYRRFQYGEPQIDDQTGEQLTYQNIVVQYVKEWNIDHNGYQTMDLTSSGKGTFITMGTAIPITWEKQSDDGITKYYTEDGEELLLNPGKTWISIFPNDRTFDVKFQ